MHNLRLVVSCAVRWHHPAVPLLDRIQEGNIGLMDAVDRFDPDRPVRFSTYAIWWIRRHVLYATEQQGPTVRFPRRVRALQARAGRTERKLRAARGEAPDAEELPAALCLPPELVRWARRVLERGLTSLDERSCRILRLRWGLDGAEPMTNAETGACLGLSAQRVNQVERVARERLRSRRELENLIGTLT